MGDESIPLDVVPVDEADLRANAETPESAASTDVLEALPVEPAIPQGVPDAQRIASIDVLRGVAVLGILIMNIQSFSMIGAAYGNPTAYGDLEGANYAVWLVSHVLADEKFMTIFSMLFGAGIVLMAARREQAGMSPAAAHYRRMGVLALFGVLHAYLFWFGDILFSYAFCGMVAYLFRRLRLWLLIMLGSLSLLIPSALMLVIGLTLPDWPETWRTGFQESWQPNQEAVAKEVAAYRGDWLSEFAVRWPVALGMQTIGVALFVAWRAGGLMLIGMALFKLGIFSAARSKTFYAVLLGIATLVGVPLILFGVNQSSAANWHVAYAKFIGSQFNYWASLAVAGGWIGLVMLVCKRPHPGPLTHCLAAVGQMALTNYLLHTLICTTLFYGRGFGLFGKVERVGQICIVFAIWAIQLLFSPLWLRYFRYGPAEWLWRSMTYWKWQNLWRGGQLNT